VALDHRRPVLSIVLSMPILVLGMRPIFQLSVSQYPQTENAVVTVATTYYGADAGTIAGFITQLLKAPNTCLPRRLNAI
jgi:multidrug efflux pump